MNTFKISLSSVREGIRQYNINQILNSGENDMIDNHIDRDEVLNLLQEKKETDVKTPEVDLNKTLKNLEENKLFDSIINLKNSK